MIELMIIIFIVLPILILLLGGVITVLDFLLKPFSKWID